MTAIVGSITLLIGLLLIEPHDPLDCLGLIFVTAGAYVIGSLA